MFTDVEGLVERGRRAMAELLTGTVRITRAGAGEPTMDPGTFEHQFPARVIVYEGPGRIQIKADINSNVVETTAGEREATYLTSTLQVPVNPPEGCIGDTLSVRPDMIAEILTCPGDDDLVGRLFNIQGTHHKSHSTHRRFRAREVIA